MNIQDAAAISVILSQARLTQPFLMEALIPMFEKMFPKFSWEWNKEMQRYEVRMSIGDGEVVRGILEAK